VREWKNGGAWRDRIRGLRANPPKRSHAELDSSPDLDIGNPLELGSESRKRSSRLGRAALLENQ
jgi:homocysteine S-methyltransferase